MRNNLTSVFLGRVGLDQLHRTEAFQWLNQALAIQVESYLNSLLGPDHGLEVHIQSVVGGVRQEGGHDRIANPS